MLVLLVFEMKSTKNLGTFKKHYQFTNWSKNLILRNIRKQMYSFNLYDWFANFRDFSKAWQMKLKLWHLILQKIVKVSSGQKNQTFCQIYMKKFFLSLPITFSVLVNVIPYQIFIQNTQITVFKKISTKFGALPILQECPSRAHVKSINWHFHPVHCSVS